MLKEEEYRKAVCEKTARTVWWGGGGNPTALLYRVCKPWFFWVWWITSKLSTQPKGSKCVHGNMSTGIFGMKF